MARTKNEKRRVKGELIGNPVAVNGGTITPVARLDGVLVRGSQIEAEYEAGFLRIQPVRAIVRNRAGEERTIAIRDIHDDIGRNMTTAGALFAFAAILVTLVRKLS